MTRREWEYMGFGFGAAIVLGVAAWGAVELGKKCLAKAKENGWLQSCCGGEEKCCCEEEPCCCEEEPCCCEEKPCCCEEDPCCCGEEVADPDEKADDDFVEKSVNAQDDVVAPEFDRNINFPE